MAIDITEGTVSVREWGRGVPLIPEINKGLLSRVGKFKKSCGPIDFDQILIPM